MTYQPVSGTVYFIGAGPGAPDLITVRGRDIIAQADLILYADSLVSEQIAQLSRKAGAQIIGSADLHLDQIVGYMVQAAQAGHVVARVHTGDPALYGAIHEQITQLAARGVPYTVVPGVTAALAAAARLGVELTLPERVQTLILSRAAGRTPVPAREALPRLAAHGASLALYLSVGQIAQVVAELLQGEAYTPQTPAAVLYRVTWPDEQIITGTLADIAERVQAAGVTRHALILVSPALAAEPAAPASRLYAQTFAHGYRAADAPRDSTASTHPPLAIIAVTRQGSTLAAQLASALDGVAVVPTRFATSATIGYDGSVVAAIHRCWTNYRQLVLIMATGVAVRAIAPLLHHKATDPAVVGIDEQGRSVIPLVGGHRAGANALARRIAAITGGHAAITTASDVQDGPALDLLGAELGWQIHPDSALTHASACLVNGDPIGLWVDPALPAAQQHARAWLADVANVTEVAHPHDLHAAGCAAGLLVTHRRLDDQQALLATCVLYHPPVLVVGVGSRRDVATEAVQAAIATTLEAAGLAQASVAALATADLKATEPGLQQAAAAFGVPLQIIPREHLAALAPEDFSPSAAQAQFGLPGIAEPCAILAAGERSTLLVPKRSFAACTVAVALADAPRPAETTAHHADGLLTLLSLGPGDPQQMTLAARAALQHADVVIGYQTYIEQIRPLLHPTQEIIARPMQSELARAQQALDLAIAGRRVALISSGDIGMYAMAGPVFELLHQHTGRAPTVHVLPGVSAFQAAAARVGSAINHDLCTISLSDLLTPWEVIEQRLWAAAAGDFVVALYNPRSNGRDWQLPRALDILRPARPPATPVLLARNVTRPDEQLIRTTLADVDPTQADMLTVVLIGNSQSYWSGKIFVTPRGYYQSPSQAMQPSAQAEPAYATTYPINLTKMQAAPVVVVGGGLVGERKVRGLLAVGARVTLISPDATPHLRAWAAERRISWEPRCYQTGDLAGSPALVFAATSERAVNAQVAHDAATLGLLCNVADVPDEGNVHLPAVYRADGLVVAVSTAGVSPARARQVRDQIAALVQQEGPQHDG